MASTLSPGGNVARASIQLDLRALQSAPAAARAAAQGVSKEIAAATKEQEAQQAAAERQRTAANKAALTQRRIAVKTAAKEEVEAQRAAQREQATAERQRTAELKAALAQRRIAVKAAAEEELRIQREAAAKQQAMRRGVATFAGAAFGGPVGGIAGALAGGSAALPLAAGLATAATARYLGEATRAASNVTEAINKTNVAFDHNARTILDWSKNSAQAFGQSRAQALEAASTFGLLFRTAEIDSGKAAVMSKRLVELAADIASINNISLDEALGKLSSGLVGEIRPLREVGVLLNDEVVTQKAVEMGLARTTNAVTDQQKVLARYELILDQTKLTQGDFARTVTDLANAQRVAQAASEDLRAEIGELVKPAATAAINAWAKALIGAADAVRDLRGATGSADSGLPHGLSTSRTSANLPRGLMGGGASLSDFTEPRFSSRGPPNLAAFTQAIVDRARASSPAAVDDETAKQRKAAQVDFYMDLQNIEKSANAARIAETASYEKQRAQTITQYALANTREEEDFQRSRFRAAQNLAKSILRVGSEAAEREAELISDRDKRIAKIRAESNEKIAEQEADFQKERLRRERDHRDTLLDAAARLDAAAVFEEQKRFSRESKDADEDHKEKQTKERKQAQERIDQEKEAAQERLDDARKADAKRIEDMKAAFEEQKTIEDEDRGIRKTRQKEDYDRQLVEMKAAHDERIAQINRQEGEERTAREEAFVQKMHDLGIENEAYDKLLAVRERLAVDAAMRFLDAIEKRYKAAVDARNREEQSRQGGGALGPYRPEYASGGFVRRTEQALVHRGEYVMTARETAVAMQSGGFPGGMGANNSRSITVAPGAIVVHAAPGMDEAALAALVRREFVATLESLL